MRKMLGMALFAILLPIHLCGAQNLVEAYQSAYRFDPSYRAARFAYEAAQEQTPQARAELLPSIGFDAQGGRINQDVNSSAGGLIQGQSNFNTHGWNFRATQPVFRYPSWAQLGQSKAVVRRAHTEFVAAEQDLMLRTVALYLNLLAALDLKALADAELKAVGGQYELVKAKRRGGLSNVTDEYEAQARYFTLEADVIEAEYAIDDARQALREVIGQTIINAVPLSAEIPLVQPEPTDVTTWVDRALAQNLALESAREAVNVAQQEIKRQRGAHLPTLDIVANYGNLTQDGTTPGRVRSDTDTADISLQFAFPIYQGGAVNSAAREAEKNYRRALEEQRFQHSDVDRRTRAAYNGVMSSIKRVNALRASLTAQQSVLEGKSKGYRAGLNTLLDVLVAEGILYETQRDYKEERYQYLINLLQLKQQTGALSEDDIVYVNGLLEKPTSAGNTE